MTEVANTTHPLYQTWYGMLSRCERPAHVAFAYYGGRGVRVCERWLDFAAFLEDVGDPPTALHTLDRYPDKNGNYEPSNVRWATREEQARNRTLRVRLPRASGVPAHVEQLRAAMIERGVLLSQFARSIGMSHASAHSILGGKTRPDTHFRLAIERLYAVPSDAWMTDNEYRIAYGRCREAT